jgi:hypothetical protein
MRRRRTTILNNKFRSLVDELSDYAPTRDRDLFIESRAQQVLASVGHLMRLIRENYDTETAEDLQKRLINSIRTEDDMKFRRKIRQIRESKEPKK